MFNTSQTYLVKLVNLVVFYAASQIAQKPLVADHPDHIFLHGILTIMLALQGMSVFVSPLICPIT